MKKEEALSSPLSKGVESRLDSRPLVIGDYTLSSLVVQEFYLDGGAMFGVVPKTLWEKVVPADSMNRIKLLARLLLISGNGRHILVDTGMGSAWSEKLSAIYALSPFTLSIELQRFGLQMHDITDVIYTHLHYDHLAGAFELQDGHLQPLFPDAMHHVQEENYRYASHPHPKEKAGYLGGFVEAFGRQKNLNLLNGDTELFKGIRLSISNGHTKGQQLVTVFDDHDQVRKGKWKARFCAKEEGWKVILNVLALNALTLGIPCVYYGSEQSFNGHATEERDGNDLFLREAMFGGTFGALESSGYHFFNESSNVYVEFAKILKIRKPAEP